MTMRSLLALALALSACSAPQTTPLAGAGLEDHVLFLSELDPPRSWEHPEALERAARYIQAELVAAGGRVESQRFEAEGNSYRNVRAFFGPAEGARLIVGAHYDVAGDHPGADDNASGSAALLALARRLGAIELERPVELVAFTLEEPPFFRTEWMGSALHARSLVAEGIDVQGLVNLEMVGYFTDEEDSQEYPLDALAAIYPSTGNFITVVGRPEDQELVAAVQSAMAEASALRAIPLVAPASLTGVDFSDHLNHWAAGFEAVMITDTSFYRNPHYHTAGDTPDTLDYTRLEQVVDGVFAAVAALATDGAQ